MNTIQTENQSHASHEATNDKPVIEITNLKKSFDGQEVLKNISLQLCNGENLVVLGRSGSGKSVLIKCIIRLMDHDEGTIEVLGEDVSALNSAGLADLRKKVGFLFQNGALYDSMTVRQNLEFPLRRVKRNLTQNEIDGKVAEVLDHVGLSDTVDKMPSQLSGGMRKRISLARTIILDPMILLYDEPTTGLDPVTSDEISSLINDVKTKYKTSSIIITHDIACARSTANRMLMLQDGGVHQVGTVEEFEKSSDPLIKSFFK